MLTGKQPATENMKKNKKQKAKKTEAATQGKKR